MIVCRVVSLDLDQTLCDHDASVRAGFVAAMRTVETAQSIGPEILLRERFLESGRALKRRADAAGKAQWPVAEQLAAAFGIQPGAILDAASAAFDRSQMAAVRLLPGVPEALAAIREAGFILAILTNGQSSIQRAKVARTGLLEFIGTVLVSSEIGAHKPDARAYATLCAAVGADPEEVVHIGDDPLHDVAGALAAGLSAIWLGGHDRFHYAVPPGVPIIRGLGEVLPLLRRPAAAVDRWPTRLGTPLRTGEETMLRQGRSDSGELQRQPVGTGRRIVRRIGEEFESVGDYRYQNCNVLHFDGREYVFSHRAILTLVTTAACNAACKFCSNEITFTPGGPYLSYSEKLEKTLAFAELAGVTKVAFTGGEPTAAPLKLYELVRKVAPRFNRARLHTNGFGLQRVVQSAGGPRSLLAALADVGLTGVSVSVASNRPADNRRVMAFKGAWTGLSDDDLRTIAETARPRLSARLSCVLTPESVHTVEGIGEYLDWGASLGFASFIFRSCSQIPDGFTKPTSFSAFNASNSLAIEPIVLALRRDSRFEEKFAQHKSDSHVHVFRRDDGLTLDVDESSEERDPDPKIRRINLMPDGVTYTSWIDPRSWLFPDEEEIAGQSMRKQLPLLAEGGREGRGPHSGAP